MDFLESNPATAALVGVALGAVVGFVGAFVAARIAASQAENDRLQARRRDWLNRLAAAIADIDTITARLTTPNIRVSSANERVGAQLVEVLEQQLEVRRELRTVGLLAAAGGDGAIADCCRDTEDALFQLVRAAYRAFEAARGTEDPSITGPELDSAHAVLADAVRRLTQVLASLNRPVT